MRCSSRSWLPYQLVALLVCIPGCAGLHGSLLTGDTETVQLLIEKGRNLNEEREMEHPTGDYHWLVRPVDLAIYLGDWGSVYSLVDHGATLDHEICTKYNGFCWHWDTPLAMAVWKHGDEIDVLRKLVAHGADPNQVIDNGRTPYHSCMTPASADFFIDELETDVDKVADGGFTLLMEAAYGRRINLARHLLSKGADPNRAFTIRSALPEIHVYGESSYHLDFNNYIYVVEWAAGVYRQSAGNPYNQSIAHSVERPQTVSPKRFPMIEMLIANGADPGPLAMNYDIVIEDGRIKAMEFHGAGEILEVWEDINSVVDLFKRDGRNEQE